LVKRDFSANLGGKAGLKLSRTAFAVMLKLNYHLQGCLEEITDAIDLRVGDDIPEEEGEERDEAIREVCIEQDHFKIVQKVWASASKMRNWLSAKKSSVTNKFKAVTEETERDAHE
jgi:hypothetical protein